MIKYIEKYNTEHNCYLITLTEYDIKFNLYIDSVYIEKSDFEYNNDDIICKFMKDKYNINLSKNNNIYTGVINYEKYIVEILI